MKAAGAPELTHIKVAGQTRAAFLLRGVLAAGAVYGAGVVRPFVGRALAQTIPSDIDILNFALSLEYLEAEFYERSLKEVPGLSGANRRLAGELYANESEHVSALNAVIKQMGGTPVGKPEFMFPTVFNSERLFLKTANTLEDTGVSAYNGAGPLLRSKEILAAAGTIVQIEGRHAALVRVARGKDPAPNPFDKPSPPVDVLATGRPFFVKTPQVAKKFLP